MTEQGNQGRELRATTREISSWRPRPLKNNALIFIIFININVVFLFICSPNVKTFSLNILTQCRGKSLAAIHSPKVKATVMALSGYNIIFRKNNCYFADKKCMCRYFSKPLYFIKEFMYTYVLYKTFIFCFPAVQIANCHALSSVFFSIKCYPLT